MSRARVVKKHSFTRVSVFNHKSGVGKTTLTMNLASALADSGKRVLLVDSDPQCNLTSYLIADDVVDELLDKADSEEGQTLCVSWLTSRLDLMNTCSLMPPWPRRG